MNNELLIEVTQKVKTVGMLAQLLIVVCLVLFLALRHNKVWILIRKILMAGTALLLLVYTGMLIRFASIDTTELLRYITTHGVCLPFATTFCCLYMMLREKNTHIVFRRICMVAVIALFTAESLVGLVF